ncbi:hypothetical protein GCM10017774_50350 [Lentzea cavernae]|uniref:Uncharacterized protein n=1 Tax=Lentzea cavernae TaxID=2020703 RepID=A0ABQ3MKW2_9PSEU|nr:hypothetical protein GCM10017774_50350 [Lentzea cavernae]
MRGLRWWCGRGGAEGRRWCGEKEWAAAGLVRNGRGGGRQHGWWEAAGVAGSGRGGGKRQGWREAAGVAGSGRGGGKRQGGSTGGRAAGQQRWLAARGEHGGGLRQEW